MQDRRLISYHACGGGGHSADNPTGLNGFLRDPAQCYPYLADQFIARGNDRVLSHQIEGWLDEMGGTHWPATVMPWWRLQAWQAAIAAATQLDHDLEVICYGSGNIGIGGAVTQQMIPFRQFDMTKTADRAVLRAQTGPARYAGVDGWALDNAGGSDADGTIDIRKARVLKTCEYLRRTAKLTPYIEAFGVNPDHTLDLAMMDKVSAMALLGYVRFHMRYAESVTPWDVNALDREAIVLVQPSSNWVDGVWTEMPWPPPPWAFPTLAEMIDLVQRGFTLAPMGGSPPFCGVTWNFDPICRAAYDACGVPWK